MAYTYPFKTVIEPTKKEVWAKGDPITKDAKGKSFDPNVWRYDKCGSVMRYSDHGDRNSEHGWEIDHIMPTSKGGRDAITNLHRSNDYYYVKVWKFYAANQIKSIGSRHGLYWA